MRGCRDCESVGKFGEWAAYLVRSLIDLGIFCPGQSEVSWILRPICGQDFERWSAIGEVWREK